MSNHENEVIAENISERACELLTELANETFGEDAGSPESDEWCSRMIATGWVDRKIEELYAAYPEGPCY